MQLLELLSNGRTALREQCVAGDREGGERVRSVPHVAHHDASEQT
jgi:hypothetical protein